MPKRLKMNEVGVLRAPLWIPSLCLLQEVLANQFELAFLVLRHGLSLLAGRNDCFLQIYFLN